VLTIVVPGIDLFDEVKEEFTTAEGFTLELEHSLVSLSKWESIFEKPFLGKDEKTTDEILGYVEAMILTPIQDPTILRRLSSDNFTEINNYVSAKRSATWFNEAPNAPKSREAITSELIYYWMISLQIPMECQHWHLNRLFTLIKIFNVKNGKPKKMSKNAIAAQNRQLNAQRRAQLGTSG
jgi:hypothetical protein